MDWFRSWHGAPTDSKWMVVAKRANVTPGMVSAVFWALLDYASQTDDRGNVSGFDVETYSLWAGWEEDDVDAVLVAMRGKGVIDEDGRLSAWDNRQPKREDDSGPRVRALRERNKAKANTVTQCNADVTQSNSRLDKSRLDKNRVEEKELAADAAPAAQPEPAKSPKFPTSAQQEMFGAIAETCELDSGLHAKKIGQTAKSLLAAGYTPEQVRQFKAWWLSDAWRYEHTPVPSLKALLDKIQQFKNSADRPRVIPQANGHANGNGYNTSKVANSLAAVDRVFDMIEGEAT